MDITGKARRLERKLSRTVDAAMGELTGPQDPAPLEIVHAVLDRAEREIQEIGRGRRVFPFTRVRIHVAGSRDREGRARVDAVFAGPPSLSDRLTERLRSAGCSDVRPSVQIVHVAQRGAGWDNARFHVSFDRVPDDPGAAAAAPVASASVPRLKLTVMQGTAGRRAYVFTGGRVDVGRSAEVLDERHRLLRTNQVAFSEEGDQDNTSVSRRHAHIAYSEGEAAYRVWDDRSAHGTHIVRGGRTIAVPSGARGTRLASGDELVLGRARLKVTIGPATESAVPALGGGGVERQGRD